MKLLKHLRKNGQRGQTLVILAIGFIALLGFVGIVTDVSVLFIRYSTMRRAVDAAAIAAAGQMRRVVDPTPGDAVAEGEAMSVANLNMAARQFIEVYGLDPKSVIVETCRAQQVGRDDAGNAYDAAYYLDPPTNSIVNPEADPIYITVTVDGKPVQQINPAADPDVVANYQELCTDDELKLVRVTAQIDAPTIFLRLLGYPTITLTESAISQTAVIDVVLIFDVSESMLNETTYDDWDELLDPPQGIRYVPAYVDGYDNSTGGGVDPITGLPLDPLNPPHNPPWPEIIYNTQGTLNDRIDRLLPTVDPDFRDKNIAYEPNDAVGSGYLLVTMPDGGTTPNGRVEPREFCRVRAYPNSGAQTRSAVPAWLADEYQDFFAATTNDYVDQVFVNGSTAYFGAFVPMYDYYGCCNDPNGDWRFDDLVCQPFRDARDAAESFLARLDFLRGDRVAFVTFDRQAYVVDPDGAGVQASMIETERDLIHADPQLARRGALETLRNIVGVRAEPSSYSVGTDGYWEGLMENGVGRDYDHLLNHLTIGSIIDQPVPGACPYDKATLGEMWREAAANFYPDTSPRNTPLLDEIVTIPQWYYDNYGGAFETFRNYEFRASCAGTNIGGALATGSATLYQEGRREGSVWIMVLLSDGAAGGSNPITRIDGEDIYAPQPFNLVTAVGSNPDSPAQVYDPVPGDGGPISGPNSPGGYGIFGLCPYGLESDDPNAMSQGDPLALDGPTLLHNAVDEFPFCSDLDPAVRNFCSSVAIMPDNALNIGDAAHPNCIDYYNVDDYARDWADWIGLSVLPNADSGGTSGRVGDQLLPTIFTIGFGLNYDEGTIVNCGADTNCIRGLTSAASNDSTRARRRRNADYLGEELLRYIADVGDNFQIDHDYWQKQLGTRIENVDADTGIPEWGPRGACEAPAAALDDTRGDTYLPAPPRESCGNYFVAATGTQLEQVFNEIASRMFTRLSQ